MNLDRKVDVGYIPNNYNTPPYWIVTPNWLTREELLVLQAKIGEALKDGNRSQVTEWCY